MIFVAPPHWRLLSELRGSVGKMLLTENELAEMLTDAFREQVRAELRRLRALRSSVEESI